MNCHMKLVVLAMLFASILAQSVFADSQCLYCSGSGRGECQFSPTGYHVSASNSSKRHSSRADHESVFEAWDGVGDWLKDEINDRFENPIFGKKWAAWSGIAAMIGVLLLVVWALLDKITGANLFYNHGEVPGAFVLMVVPWFVTLLINLVWFIARVLWMFAVRLFG